MRRLPGVGGDLRHENVGCGHDRGIDDERRHSALLPSVGELNSGLMMVMAARGMLRESGNNRSFDDVVECSPKDFAEQGVVG
jgi:hypothetical protein